MSENKKERTLVPAGSHQTKIKSWGAMLNPNGKALAWVKFENGSFWRGYFVGGASEFTTENLVKMGFKGANPNDLNNDTALVKGMELEVVVEHKNYEGKVYDEVKYINTPHKRKELDPGDVQTLKGIDLRGYVKQAEDKAPEDKKSSTNNQAQNNSNPENTYSDADMPDWAR